MHSPRPYGLATVGGELTDDDSAFIELAARRLTNQKELSGLASLRAVHTLPDGGYVVITDAGGTFRVVAHKPEAQPSQRLRDGLAKPYIPMLYSGVVTRALIRQTEGVGLRLTDQARRRLVGYDPAKSLPAKDVTLHRFRVEYGPAFSYFKPSYAGIMAFTQYLKQRPTWYSGAMREVMQIVGGYGRQIAAELPDEPIERAQFQIPEKSWRRILSEIDGQRLPGYTGFPHEEGQFQYDYKFDLCHGVSFDKANQPWLVQVGRQGVHAMPLPTIPATTTAAFRAYMEECADAEILAILDRFGGLPSGEAFPPAGADFEAWRRAGVIIKICDSTAFYRGSAFYAACGWAFNSRGSEGFNTCWEHDEQGLMQAYGYTLRLELGAAVGQGKRSPAWTLDDARDQTVLNAYLERLFAAVPGHSAREVAIRYKIMRQPLADVLARARSQQGPDVDHWDNLEAPPIAVHAGSMSRSSSGPVPLPRIGFKSMSALKFPELTGKGCESFAQTSPDYWGEAVRCDTVLFGCYIEDQLHVIKYFVDERTYTRAEESNFDEVMIIGQWEKTVTTGVTGLMGRFYTTAFDDRQEASEIVTTTNIVGTDLGYGNPRYQTPPLITRLGSLSRSRYYKRITKNRTTRGFSLGVAVCVPVFERNAMLYAYSESTTSKTEAESGSRGSVPDPTSYQLWCHDSIWHYMDATRSGNKGSPPSKDGVPVYLDTMIYRTGTNSDFADSGNWFNFPVGSFVDVTDICGPFTSRYAETHHANGVIVGGEAPQFESYQWKKDFPGEVSGRLSAALPVANVTVLHRDPPDAGFFAFSPQEDMYFYRDATAVAIGDAAYASLDNGAKRRFWGYSALADHKSAHHFIGVINE